MKNSSEVTLCVGIPTYNRATRLDKAISDLFVEIKKSKYAGNISIFISNNGSTDNTKDVIEKYKIIFREEGIIYRHDNLVENLGFDANVINCYEKSDADYVWILSDDDNIEGDSISTIFSDIEKHTPSVIYYNFNQVPWDKNNPYIKRKIYIDSINEDSISGITSVINNPKLSSLVFKCYGLDFAARIKKICGVDIVRSYGFIHCALQMEMAFLYGRVLLSDNFIAYPDNDYTDHIDFAPYIGVELINTIDLMLNANDKMIYKKYFSIKLANPLTSAMNTLSTFYRGRMVLTPELKNELFDKLKEELSNDVINKIAKYDFIMHAIRFIYAIINAKLYEILKHRKLYKLKDRSDSYDNHQA